MYDLTVMVHDKPSEDLQRFFEKRWTDDLQTFVCTKKQGRGGWHYKTEYDSCNLEKLLEPFRTLENAPITMYGYGGFHHYTYALTKHVMEPRSSDFLYVHIDYHTDARKEKGACEHDYRYPTDKPRPVGFVPCGGRRLTCGGFVEEIKKNGAKNFLFIGTDSLCGWRRKKWVKQKEVVESTNLKGLIRTELKKKRCNEAYISMDLDALDYYELPTGYGRGKMTLEHLLDILSVIQENKRIVAADILGLCGRGNGSYYDVLRGWKRSKYSCGEDYYELIGYLTYGIIASHLMGRDYSDAMALRTELVRKLKDKDNGTSAEHMARGVFF